MGLYEKMFNVMNESEAIEKNMVVGSGKNSYKAVSEAAMLNMVKPLFKKYKLIIFPISGDIQEIVHVYNKTDYDNKTTESQRAITQLKVTFRILDIETNEFQDVVGFGNGADSQDKGAGKAYTYSLKNALSKTFMLFSGEDTDNTHSDDIDKPKGEKLHQHPDTTQVEPPQNKTTLEKQANVVPEDEEFVIKKSKTTLEKQAIEIYWECCGTKEEQLKWTKDQYNEFLKGLKELGKISDSYSKKWTQEDIKVIKAEIETIKAFPF